MVKVFKAHRRNHPFKRGSAIDYKFDMLIKGYRAKDASVEQEVVVTPRFLQQVYSRARTNKE